MLVTETDYLARKEYYADLLHQAQQELQIRNQRKRRSHWRSLLTQLLDTVRGTIQNIIGNRLTRWREGAEKQQLHRFENTGIKSAL